jgi:hypothetical protein
MEKVLRTAPFVKAGWVCVLAAATLLAGCAIDPPSLPEHKPPTNTAILAEPPVEKPAEVEKPAAALPFAVPPPPKPQAFQVFALAAPQAAQPSQPVEPAPPVVPAEPVEPPYAMEPTLPVEPPDTVEPASPAEPALPTPRPETLVGLDPAQTENLLGPPAAVREQSPATIWSYMTTDCKLDLYFYMDMASKRLNALSYELKNQNGQSNDALASQCLRQLTEAKRNAFR